MEYCIRKWGLRGLGFMQNIVCSVNVITDAGKV